MHREAWELLTTGFSLPSSSSNFNLPQKDPVLLSMKDDKYKESNTFENSESNRHSTFHPIVKLKASNIRDPCFRALHAAIVNALVDRWHFPMLNDKVRNLAFKDAINSAIEKISNNLQHTTSDNLNNAVKNMDVKGNEDHVLSRNGDSLIEKADKIHLLDIGSGTGILRYVELFNFNLTEKRSH